MTEKAMRLALEALEEINKLSVGENAIFLPAEIDGAMDALRQALEQQPADEQVKWDASAPIVMTTHPAFSRPQPAAWVGLTDEERNLIGRHHAYVDNIIKATEAKLKEKNG